MTYSKSILCGLLAISCSLLACQKSNSETSTTPIGITINQTSYTQDNIGEVREGSSVFQTSIQASQEATPTYVTVYFQEKIQPRGGLDLIPSYITVSHDGSTRQGKWTGGTARTSSYQNSRPTLLFDQCRFEGDITLTGTFVYRQKSNEPEEIFLWPDGDPFAQWLSGEPYWDGPWGHGRPGWHIECSAMARKHLGQTIDLHAGGQDLVFPHHENEIAQSECANGCTFSRYWMHNGFLNINNEKMSKSKNNFFTVREIAERYGYEPIRYFMLTAGYRMPLNYTVELIESCKSSLERLYTCRENLDFAIEHAHGGSDELAGKADAAREKFIAAMDDDLNTPDALAAIFEFVKEINTLSDGADKPSLEAAAKTFDELAGVLGLLYNRKKAAVPPEVEALVAERAAAKKAKDFARADALRAEIAAMGWTVVDTAQGPQVSKN